MSETENVHSIINCCSNAESNSQNQNATGVCFGILLLSVGMVLRNTLANVVYKVVVGILSCKFYFLGEIGLLKLKINAFERT